jgi:hypothetical protein
LLIANSLEQAASIRLQAASLLIPDSIGRGKYCYSLLITHYSPAYRQAGCFLLTAYCFLLFAHCLLLLQRYQSGQVLLLITDYSLLTDSCFLLPLIAFC